MRLYDAILLDECSQIPNDIGEKVTAAINEQPQKPFVGIAADYKQLQPVLKKSAKGVARSHMAGVCKGLPTITLNTIYRTEDPALLDFLNHVRDEQSDRDTIY